MKYKIICSCGYVFWRKYPCTPKLRTWTCPRFKRKGKHDTIHDLGFFGVRYN